MIKRCQEPQYEVDFQEFEKAGPVRLGPMWSYTWRADPRHLSFTLARYKFVAKMLYGVPSALEVGCGDGFGAGVVRQEVPIVHGLDFDPRFVSEANEQWKHKGGMNFFVQDMMERDLQPRQLYAAVFSLDVLEHIPPAEEEVFLANLCKFLEPGGVAIIGSPSLESQAYASEGSKAGHVNCKSGYELKSVLSRYFKYSFLFGFNDEVLHTGYSRMAHYNVVLCAEKLR